jgi:hypothetical protein
VTAKEKEDGGGEITRSAISISLVPVINKLGSGRMFRFDNQSTEITCKVCTTLLYGWSCMLQNE